MKCNNQFRLSAITLAMMTLLTQAQAQAQTAAAETSTTATKPANESKPEEVQQIVVTGNARAGGQRKIDASYSITTATEEQVKQAAPSSTADLLKIVPGIYAESSGGNAGANIGVRGFPIDGDAPFVTIQMNGSPLFPPPTLSFLEGSSLFRIDDTIERVEVLRGGPSPIFSNGQPGATMNFLLKKGRDVPEGSLRATVGTGNLRRIDGYYGGKISDGWYGTIGGFYRVAQGVRDGQYPADEGGQITATVTRKLDQGELTFYARSVNDKNTFYTGVPLISAGTAGGNPGAFPGFDPLTGSLYSNELRNVSLEVGPGQTLQKDLANGRGLQANLFGVDFSQNINGWNVSNKLNHFSGDAPTLAIFTGNSPVSAASYINSAIQSANGQANVVTAAGGKLATSGTATYLNGGAAVSADQQVMSAGIWSVEKKLTSFTDELRISKEIVKDHTLTGGVYYADYSSKDQWYLGNSVLMTATSNARPINVALNNGVVVSGNGHDGASFFTLNENFSAQNTAFFLTDEWKINDRVRVDAGVRTENRRLNGVISNAKSVDLDNNPLTLYNNSASVLSGSNTPVNRTDSEVSYTLGGNYKVSENFSVFARLNSGFALPQFDTIRDNGVGAPVTKVKQYELGLKTVTEQFSAYLTFFHNTFTGLSFQQFLADGSNVTAIGGSSGSGLEFEVAARPVKNFQISLSGAYQSSKYENYGANTGHEVKRQPKLQFRLSPSYRIPLDNADIKLYGTYTHVDARYADAENQQSLPKYYTLDAGVLVGLGDNLEFRLAGTNLTNQLGLTEGNSRVIGGGSSVVFARPIFGRAIEASVLYRF
ncbi:TonB-dependent receptor [Undibacterium sp. TJN19]|uniref:TonB-dependent receptor n=1 Tax=Undibacterium sp. TJN19 TaxID=3413055 RepID=UPI003BEF643D